jgi:prefoldin subunit 4
VRHAIFVVVFILTVPCRRYRIGESYLHIPHPYAIKRLGRDQADIDDQINKSSSTAEQCEKGMKDLKVVLYAKFGTSINLDE